MMKNKFILFLALSPLLLVGCTKPAITMPKSPFKDNYKRIGMTSEYSITDSITQKDFNKIKEYVVAEKDVGVTNYKREEEFRDLKYAYFGKESSTISQCSMLSRKEDISVYKNDVTVTNDKTDQQVQSANSGKIIKTSSLLEDYIYNDDYMSVPLIPGTYSHHLRKTNNDEEPEVTILPGGSYSTDDDRYTIFAAKPLKRFSDAVETYGFKLLGDNVIYGQTHDNYLVKEGYSHFDDFKTTMGRTYKSVNNYFYEGLLEKYNENGEEKYRFTNFRFYRELLILSKAFVENVPIIYLTKPVLIEYSEVKYEMSYADIGNYTEAIPF